jgi:hypothetical protein
MTTQKEVALNLLVRRYLNRTHLVEQLVENWQLDHKEAMAARDLEELVSECVDLAALGRRAWRMLLSRMFDAQERSDRVFAAEDLIKSVIHRTAGIFAVIGKSIKDVERFGYVVEGATEFQKATHDVKQLETETAEPWPPIDPKLAQESLEAYKRGDYRLAEDILHELQGGGAQAD